MKRKGANWYNAAGLLRGDPDIILNRRCHLLNRIQLSSGRGLGRRPTWTEKGSVPIDYLQAEAGSNLGRATGDLHPSQHNLLVLDSVHGGHQLITLASLEFCTNRRIENVSKNGQKGDRK